MTNKKTIKAWMHKSNFIASKREVTHKAKLMYYGSDPFNEVKICFKKPTNPEFVNVEISLVTPSSKVPKKRVTK